MRPILCTVLGMALAIAFADHAAAASTKKRSKALYCSAEGYCTSVPPRAAPPRQRGYRPPQRSGREYDYPRFGSERWWQLQEDQD